MVKKMEAENIKMQQLTNDAIKERDERRLNDNKVQKWVKILIPSFEECK